MQFAYKILRKLSKAGYVKATRGASGGYSLSADLSLKNLLDLMSSLGSLDLVSACMDPSFQCRRREELGGACAIHVNLCGLKREIDGILTSRSIASILGVEQSTSRRGS